MAVQPVYTVKGSLVAALLCAVLLCLSMQPQQYLPMGVAAAGSGSGSGSGSSSSLGYIYDGGSDGEHFAAPDTIAVTLPFSRLGAATNVTDIVSSSSRSHSGGNGAAPSSTTVPPAIEQLYISPSPSSAADGEEAYATVERVLAATDEHFLLFFYDSLDPNSVRVARHVDAAAGLLKGFVTTVGLDVRRESLQWLLNAWNVQLVPSLKVLPATTRQLHPRGPSAGTGGLYAADSMAALAGVSSAALLGGRKVPTDMAPASNPAAMMAAAAWGAEHIRKFALAHTVSSSGDGGITKVASDKVLGGLAALVSGRSPATYPCVMAPPPPSPLLSCDAWEASLPVALAVRADVPKPIVLLFTDKASTPALFRALALRFAHRAVAVEVRAKDAPKAAAAFGVQQFPSLFVIPTSTIAAAHAHFFGEKESEAATKEDADVKSILAFVSRGGRAIRYTGDLNMEDLVAFVGLSAVTGTAPRPCFHRLQQRASNAWFAAMQNQSRAADGAAAHVVGAVLGAAEEWEQHVAAHVGPFALSTGSSAAVVPAVGLIAFPAAGDATGAASLRDALTDVRSKPSSQRVVAWEVPASAPAAAATLEHFARVCAVQPEEADALLRAPTTAGKPSAAVLVFAVPTGADAASRDESSTPPPFLWQYRCAVVADAAVLRSPGKLGKALHYYGADVYSSDVGKKKPGQKKRLAGGAAIEAPVAFDWTAVPNPFAKSPQ